MVVYCAEIHEKKSFAKYVIKNDGKKTQKTARKNIHLY